MKVYDSYVNVLKAIDCYDDAVLLEARDWGLALIANRNTANTDSLLDELNAQFEDDCRAIGEWDEQEEVCTNDERLGTVLGRTEMLAAIDRWNFDEDQTEALTLLLMGMLRRSVSYEKMYR